MSAATYSFRAVDAAGTPEKGEISGVPALSLIHI